MFRKNKYLLYDTYKYFLNRGINNLKLFLQNGRNNLKKIASTAITLKEFMDQIRLEMCIIEHILPNIQNHSVIFTPLYEDGNLISSEKINVYLASYFKPGEFYPNLRSFYLTEGGS